MSWLPWAVAAFLGMCAVSLCLQWWQGRQLVRTVRLRLADVEAVQEGTTEAVEKVGQDLLEALDAIRTDAQDGREERERQLGEVADLLRRVPHVVGTVVAQRLDVPAPYSARNGQGPDGG